MSAPNGPFSQLPSSPPIITDSQGNPVSLPANNQNINGSVFRTQLIYNSTPAPGSPNYPQSTNNGSLAFNMVPYSDQTGTNYSPGFMPQGGYYVNPSLTNPTTGYPVEAGNFLDPASDQSTTSMSQLSDIKFREDFAQSTFDDFDDESGLLFRKYRSNLDKGNAANLSDFSTIDPNTGNPIDTTDLYVSSYIQTRLRNEDPIMYGYDINIIYDSSPLFNGSIDQFLSTYGTIGGITEIESRIQTLSDFISSFWDLFSFDVSFTSGSTYSINNIGGSITPSGDITNPDGSVTMQNITVSPAGSSSGNNTTTKRTYYLKKLSGLNNLVEKTITNNADGNVKNFIEYGKDLITLTLNEDVSMTTGRLAMLYKTLCWSRINGKQVIPENLLRFDVEITVTEIRKFNRVIHDFQNSNFDYIPDQLTKFTYRLYECQFMFPDMPHGNDIDMSDTKILEGGFDISFNYKFSTVLMNTPLFPAKPTNNDSGTYPATLYQIDNEQFDPHTLTGQEYVPYNSTTGQGSQINSTAPGISAPIYQSVGIGQGGAIYPVVSDDNSTTTSNSSLDAANSSSAMASALKVLEKKVVNAAIGVVNNQISIQAALLSNTLNNIASSIGINGVSPPTNVYTQQSFSNIVSDAIVGFVGQSVRGFFTPPTD